MGRNRKKHKKKLKEKVVNYSVKEAIPIVSEMSTSIAAKKIVNQSVNWSNMRVMVTGRGRRRPIYV